MPGETTQVRVLAWSDVAGRRASNIIDSPEVRAADRFERLLECLLSDGGTNYFDGLSLDAVIHASDGNLFHACTAAPTNSPLTFHGDRQAICARLCAD